MLGHLKPRSCQLNFQAKQHYQQLYCSLCYSLRQQFGLSASLLISHELILSLVALPDTTTLPIEQCACPARLFCWQKTIHRAPVIDKAAQLCLLLVWLKLLDSETDSPAFYKQRLRKIIEQKVQPVLANLSPDTQQFIDAYLLLIRADSTDFTVMTKMSGLLAQHVFRELCQQPNSTTVTEITLLLGELITIADALLDLARDSQQQQYNPIIVASQQNQTSLAEERTLLTANYDSLVATIWQRLDESDLNTVNPLFTDVLQQSLRNLTAKIQRSDTTLFAADSRNNNRRNNARSSNRWSECLDACCDSFDCCQCCGESSNCCCTAGEGGCCECGCCDCAGCDCSC
jgi:hypothetical protein